jgi:two-component system chemotaxis sensor kinase CheA
MNDKERDFLRTLQAAFRGEAAEHLQAMAAGLLELEHTPDGLRRNEILSVVFREAHSLKGAARAVDRKDIEAVCQTVEDIFSRWRAEGVQLTPQMFDGLQHAISTMEAALASSTPGGAGPNGDEIREVLEQLHHDRADERPRESARDASAAGSSPAAGPAMPTTAPETDPHATKPVPSMQPAGEPRESPVEPPRTAATPPAAHPSSIPVAPITGSSETLRISTAKLDGLFLEAEELLALKLLANHRAAEVSNVLETIDGWEKEWAEVADQLRAWEQCGEVHGRADGPTRQPTAAIRLAGLADRHQDHLRELMARLTSLMEAIDRDRRTTARMVDRVLEDAKKLLMLPFSTLFSLFPKLVRDLSRDQGKEVELVVGGTEVEVDKRILEEIKDPLIHLLRNCVDHGIETPLARAEAGKPSRGTITLGVSQVHGNKVEVCLADDGAGIDLEAVSAAAVRKGFLSVEESARLSEAETLALVFRPELSTSRLLTEISGRGLGLAIVKEKVDKIGGWIELQSRRSAGTTFRLVIPLTLATFKGVMVEAGGQVLVMPTVNTEHVCRVRPDQILMVENRETIRFEDRVVALVRLDDLLELPRRESAADGALLPVLIASDGQRRIALAVDAVLGEQEVLLKRLGQPLSRVRNIAGATVLGSGKVVPVLNAADLLKSAVRLNGRAAGRAAPGDAPRDRPAAQAARSLLVVEDSVTARMLIRGILESAGYRVKTAVDGVDAWTALKTDDFDLVVSDVEMPRMNGFDLTTRIRGNQRLAEMPVVLVTARDSRTDRERGVEAGANAYIVKSGFDQNNLLEVVRRLL